MDPTGVVTVISLLSAAQKKPALLHPWRKNELMDGNILWIYIYILKKKYTNNTNWNVHKVYSVNRTWCCGDPVGAVWGEEQHVTFGADVGGLHISRKSPVLQARQKSTLITSEEGKYTLEPGWETLPAL